MSQLGYDSIFGPGCVCSNIAQGTAGLVVALRTKNGQEKQLATSSRITALMGITEPILYSTNHYRSSNRSCNLSAVVPLREKSRSSTSV